MSDRDGRRSIERHAASTWRGNDGAGRRGGGTPGRRTRVIEEVTKRPHAPPAPEPEHHDDEENPLGTDETAAAEVGETVDGWVVYETTARKIRGTGGTLSWLCNNPGNIMVTSNHVNDGGLYGDLKRTFGLYRIFRSYAEGREGIRRFIQGWGKVGKTLHGLAYLPYGDPGHEKTYLDLWTKATGASENTKLSDLTDEQLEKMADAIQNMEGWRAGIEASRSDEPGPGKPPRVFRGGS